MGKNQDSGINIPDPQHFFFLFLWVVFTLLDPDCESGSRDPIESGSRTWLLLLSYFSELGCAHGGERRGPQRGGPRHQAEH